MKNAINANARNRALPSVGKAKNNAYVKKIALVNKISEQRKILLVEDNLIAQMVNKRALEQAGYKVETAESGEQTLNRFAHADYSLIFMDIDLPDISGIEVTSKIRSSNSRIPIIALTTDVSEKTKKRCLAVGMNDFANKPISGASLSKLANQYCGA